MDNSVPTDVLLMQGIACGDREAFRKLYQVHCPRLLAISLRIVKRRDVAEDILQEVFVHLWSGAHSFDSHLSSPRTWLSYLVRNKSIDWLRARDNQWQSDDDMELAQPDLNNLTPDTLVQSEESERRLLNCLNHLPVDQQQSIALAWFQGFSHSDIARYMDKPAGSVKSWIRRGLEHLKECVGL